MRRNRFSAQCTPFWRQNVRRPMQVTQNERKGGAGVPKKCKIFSHAKFVVGKMALQTAAFRPERNFSLRAAEHTWG